jgi:hypothetical protein
MSYDYTHSIDIAHWICGGENIISESHCKHIIFPELKWIGTTHYFNKGQPNMLLGIGLLAEMNYLFTVDFRKKRLNLLIPFYPEKKKPLLRSQIH